MKNLYKVLAVTVALLFGVAHAEEQISKSYVEVGYVQLDVKSVNQTGTFTSSPQAVSLAYGYKLHNNLAAEAVVMQGVKSDTLNRNGVATNVAMEVNTSYGVFLKPSIDYGKTTFFGKVGYMEGKITSKTYSASSSESRGGLAYGLGVSHLITDKVSVNAGWTSFYDKDGVTSKGVTLGFGYKF